MNNLTFNLFKSINQPRPSKSWQQTAEEFCAMVNAWVHKPVEDKKKAAAFSMCQYGDGGKRRDEDILTVSAIVLDIDKVIGEEKLESILDSLKGKAYVVYTTFSSKPGAYKLRAMLPLDEPMARDEFKEKNLTLRAAKMIGTPIDRCSLNATQLYFMPICAPGEEAGHRLQVGESLEGWTEDDLPEWEPGDERRYLDRSAKSSKGEKPKKSKQEIYQRLDTLVADHFGGVPPIYCEHAFHLYEDGCWWTLESKALTRHLMVDVFEEKVGLDEITVLIDYMRVRYYHETFPEADGRMLICTANGTLDPFAGGMVPQSPEHYLRYQMPYPFEPEAQCEGWLQFVAEIFCGDPDQDRKILLLQEFMGYLLIPSSRFQAMLWLHGAGANGKSVINEVISYLLGENNVTAIPLDRLSKRFQSAELVGKLANLTDEVGAEGSLRDDILKQAVSGGLIQGERKNKDPFNFRPYARFVVAMNHLPRIKDTSFGFFRRLQLLTFNRRFEAHEQDRDLSQKLKAELPGIFVWALEGLQRLWAQGNFTVVPSSIAAIEQYKKECNPVALFVNDLVVPAVGGATQEKRGGATVKTLIHDVYRTYQAYCRAKGFQPLSDARFGREMSGLGYTAVKSGGKRFYPLTLRKPEDVGINGMFAPQVTQFTRLEDAFGRDDPELMAA